MMNIASELKNIRNAAIAGHIRPDGDCVGACVGMYLYIKKNYPEISQVQVYLQPISEANQLSAGTSEIVSDFSEDHEYDLFIALDCGNIDRLGKASKYLTTAKRSICIDHHVSNTGYADVNHIKPDASSACEMLYELFDPDLIDQEIAEALYMGIVNDTGVFQYSCTTPKTMRIAAELMEKGIEFSDIIEKSFFEKTYVQNQILGRTLLESMLILDGKCIVGGVTQRVMDFYGVVSSDLEGIVSQMRNTKGVEVAIFIYAIKQQEYKVSLRSSEKVDVSKIATYFGGGGHKCAAGCEMQGSFHDVINNLSALIEKQL